MFNYFVATVGKRDVQINRNKINENHLSLIYDGKNWYIKETVSGDIIEIDAPGNNMSDPGENHYTVKKPRIGGKIILKNDLLFSVCEFPIISPVLEKIFSAGKNIKEIKLVYTDQEDEGYRDGDTLYFSTIITKYIEDTFNIPVDEFAVWRSPADIDKQYADFRHKKSLENINLLPNNEEVNEIYLLAQGGIDQINFALTLRLIENYREKLIYYQKPEKGVVCLRDFPFHFIKNLTRNQTIELIKNWEFKGAQQLLASATLKTLCEFASLNIELNYIEAEKLSQDDRIKEIPFIAKYFEEVSKLTDSQFRQLILSISLLHDYYKGEPNNLLWKLRTLGEIILLPEVEEFLGLSNINYNQYDFTTAVEAKIDNGRSLIEYLLTKNEYKIKKELEKGKLTDDYNLLQLIYNFKYIANPSAKKNATEKMRIALMELRELRNELIHKGYFVTLKELENAFHLKKYTIESVQKHIELYINSIGVTTETLQVIKLSQSFCIDMLNEDNW